MAAVATEYRHVTAVQDDHVARVRGRCFRIVHVRRAVAREFLAGAIAQRNRLFIFQQTQELVGGVRVYTITGYRVAFALAIAAIRRTLTWPVFKKAVVETLSGTAGIFLVVIGTVLLTRFMALSGLPRFIAEQFITLGAVFLAVTGALVAALLRTILAGQDDPLVMVVVAGLLWLFTSLELSVGAFELSLALLIASGFGYLSWLTGTASVSGMLAGIVSGLLTIVFGGFGWFVVLITFFGLGGFASQYRYDDKRDLGVAEANEGARGSANVLSNAAVALVAVIGFAAADQLEFTPLVFTLAFAGSLATAMSDTFSSELGILLGRPVLITTFEPVDPGTDGGITLRGTLVGAVGAAIIAGIAVALLDVGLAGGILVLLAGTVGMLVDSLLGATLEGPLVGNQSVNFLATLAGALLCVVLASSLGMF
jgi:uncharacterized protein (TIGR00297 family)